MKQYNSARFNTSAIINQEGNKLIPMIEVVVLTEEPCWVANTKKKIIERTNKASEIRFSATKQDLLKLQSDLVYAIENIDNMQKICDTAKIIPKIVDK